LDSTWRKFQFKSRCWFPFFGGRERNLAVSTPVPRHRRRQCRGIGSTSYRLTNTTAVHDFVVSEHETGDIVRAQKSAFPQDDQKLIELPLQVPQLLIIFLEKRLAFIGHVLIQVRRQRGCRILQHEIVPHYEHFLFRLGEVNIIFNTILAMEGVPTSSGLVIRVSVVMTIFYGDFGSYVDIMSFVLDSFRRPSRCVDNSPPRRVATCRKREIFILI
jgi:hypothetical protein